MYPLYVSFEHTLAVGLEAILGIGALIVSITLYRRRRSGAYLLVALATATFVAGAGLGILEVLGVRTVTSTDAADHAFDALTLLLLIAAIVITRGVEGRVPVALAPGFQSTDQKRANSGRSRR